MPRGRHRHSPPLHRLLPPSAIAGVALVYAVGPWLFTEPAVLRGLAAGAALTTVLGSVVMRRWDTAAGKRVAELTRARASDEWRYEERVAELETDLEESRELRAKLEQRLRAKRTELANLRNEHAALLRRYATAETERATALEGRRLLAIESSVPARALPASSSDAASRTPGAVASPGAAPVPSADSESVPAAEAAPTVPAPAASPASERAGDPQDAPGPDAVQETESAPEDAAPASDSDKAFSPTGSSLFLRANSALDRIVGERAAQTEPGPGTDDPGTDDPGPGAPAKGPSADAGSGTTASKATAQESPAKDTSAQQDGTAEDTSGRDGAGQARAREDEAEGKPGAVDGHQRAAAVPAAEATAATRPTTGRPAETAPVTRAAPAASRAAAEDASAASALTPVKPTKPVKSVRPSGHFTVPTAVAVVPTAPRRRQGVEGGFDFFGTQKGTSPDALEAVQNEDLADVVGQEALALHKAESEAVQFKPADEESRGVGQVIDLTAHDETEQIDVAELRSAVS
jgi:hypothetical protein